MNFVGKKGVDVSSLNGNVNFENVKKAGYDFAMIRCGYGSDIIYQDDTQFENNVKKCESLGVPWGTYLYSYALNAEQARSELSHILRLLKNKKPLFPVALDVEDSDDYRKNHGGWNYSNVTTCTGIVLDGLKAAGCYRYTRIFLPNAQTTNHIFAKFLWKYNFQFLQIRYIKSDNNLLLSIRPEQFPCML